VPLWAAVTAGAAGAAVGDSLGYALGRRVGERLLARIPRRLVQPRQVERATALLRRRRSGRHRRPAPDGPGEP
jgi:membrane-associated protein